MRIKWQEESKTELHTHTTTAKHSHQIRKLHFEQQGKIRIEKVIVIFSTDEKKKMADV